MIRNVGPIYFGHAFCIIDRDGWRAVEKDCQRLMVPFQIVAVSGAAQTVTFTFAALLMAGCTSILQTTIDGSRNVATEQRDVQNFDRIVMTGSDKLVITQTGQESLTVEGEDNLLAYLETEVKDGKLRLGVRNDVSLRRHEPMVFRVTVKDLHGISLLGSGDVEAERIRTDYLASDIQGSGNLTVTNVVADHVAVVIRGSGDLRISGQSSKQDVTIAGSGDYHGERFETAATTVGITGSGSANVHAKELLEANIRGSGDIQYHGEPTISTTITGSGTVAREG